MPNKLMSEKTTLCLLKLDTYEQVRVHNRQCLDCAKVRENSNKNRTKRTAWKHETAARCGIMFPSHNKAAQHQKGCDQCQAIKRINIARRMAETTKKTPERSKIYSDTARRTSARPEIQEARAEQLRAWRERTPGWYENIRDKFIGNGSKKTKQERWLCEYLGWEGTFLPCQGGSDKQVDLASPDLSVIIEIDGYYHFFENPGYDPRRKRQRTLKDVQDRDELLIGEVLRRGITLIRISNECFQHSTGRMRLAWIPTLDRLLKTPAPGVWCLGKLYGSCPWANERCTILKCPDPVITSS